MSGFLFPDNTVLCNYAVVDRMDLLEHFLGTSGRWTQAVYSEVRASSRVLRPLRTLLNSSLLGEPIEVTDHDAVARLREGVFGGSASQSTQHLGEAETLYVLQAEEAVRGSTWVTDDVAAYDFAERVGISVMDTRGSLEFLIRTGLASVGEAHRLLREMSEADRHPRNMPRSVDDLR